MIDIFNLWEKFIGEANTWQGGHVKPQRQFTHWVNSISKELFIELTDEAEKSNKISDNLSPFLKSKNVTVTRQSGQFYDIIVKPDDYERFSGCRTYMDGDKFFGNSELSVIVCNKAGKAKEVKRADLSDTERSMLSQKAIDNLIEIKITKVAPAKWSAALAHVNLRPTLKNAKCTPFDSGLKLAPKNIPIVVLDYYRLPREALFNYTLTAPGTESEYIAYNPTGSVSLEWSPTLIPEFVGRLVKKYGKYVKDQLLMAS